METITQVIEALRLLDEHHFSYDPGCSLSSIIELEEKLKLTLCNEHRTLLQFFNGGELSVDLNNEPNNFGYSIIFFETWRLENEVYSNKYIPWNTDLPGMVFFATDQGSSAIYYDPDNRLNYGENYIFTVDRGYLNAKWSQPVANNLVAFFDKILSGNDIFSGPFLKDIGPVPDIK